jgi:hypothetical protein
VGFPLWLISISSFFKKAPFSEEAFSSVKIKGNFIAVGGEYGRLKGRPYETFNIKILLNEMRKMRDERYYTGRIDVFNFLTTIDKL